MFPANYNFFGVKDTGHDILKHRKSLYNICHRKKISCSDTGIKLKREIGNILSKRYLSLHLFPWEV